ncbi:MAG: hypothetical protein ACQER7_15645 [Bacteroidota bacterium]
MARKKKRPVKIFISGGGLQRILHAIQFPLKGTFNILKKEDEGRFIYVVARMNILYS